MSVVASKKAVLKSAESLKDDIVGRASCAATTIEHDAALLQDGMVNGAADLAESVTTRLKAVGVDTDVLAAAAKDQASALQRLIADELRAHPLRALGMAAAVGVFVGLLTTR